MIATMTKPLVALLAKLKPLGKRPTTEQKMDRLLDAIDRTPTPEQVMKAVNRLARLERKIERREERHIRRDLDRAAAIAQREAADRHPVIVRPAEQWELPERWQSDDVALNH